MAMSFEDVELEMEAAALVALAEHGIPPDIQELLVRGNAAYGIAPGALRKVVKVLLYLPKDDK